MFQPEKLGVPVKTGKLKKRNISGRFADTVCIGGKMHGVRLFAFIYKRELSGYPSGQLSFLAGFLYIGCQKTGGKEYYQNRWQSGKRYGRISVYRLWKIYCVSAEKILFLCRISA